MRNNKVIMNLFKAGQKLYLAASFLGFFKDGSQQSSLINGKKFTFLS